MEQIRTTFLPQTKIFRRVQEGASRLLRANLKLTVAISQVNFQLDLSIAKIEDFPLEKEKIQSKDTSHLNYKKEIRFQLLKLIILKRRNKKIVKNN
jgi:hypothetical protein